MDIEEVTLPFTVITNLWARAQRAEEQYPDRPEIVYRIWEHVRVYTLGVVDTLHSQGETKAAQEVEFLRLIIKRRMGEFPAQWLTPRG